MNKEEKFYYAQAIQNLTMSKARILTKMYDKDKKNQLKYFEQSYRVYAKY